MTDLDELEATNAKITTHTNEYRECRQAYEDDRKMAFNGQIKCHSFDFQQVVEVPHVPLQPGQWYYWSPFKLYVFGLVNEAIDQHFHAVYTEAQQGKGANQVMSLLHSYLTAKDNLGTITHLWADNCSGQNKNKTVMWYLAWIVQHSTDSNSIIELRFQIKGHTRNSVNRGFALTKNEANKSEVLEPEDYLAVINRATGYISGTQRIHPVSFINESNGGFFRDWESAFSSFMRPLDGIQKYHFFRFEVACPGIVKVKRLPKDSWNEFNLFKRNATKQHLLYTPITVIPLKDIGLVDEKRHDMWSKYGKYAPVHLQNRWLYQSPDSDLIV